MVHMIWIISYNTSSSSFYVTEWTNVYLIWIEPWTRGRCYRSLKFQKLLFWSASWTIHVLYLGQCNFDKKISIFVRFLIHNWNLDCTRMSPSCYLEMKHKKEFIISELWWLPPEHFVKFSDKNCQKSRSCFHRSRFKRSTGFPFIHLGSYNNFSKFVPNYAPRAPESEFAFCRLSVRRFF